MFIVHLLVGAGVASVVFLLVRLARQGEVRAPILGWILAGAGLLYAALVVEVIAVFVDEGVTYLAPGSYQAAAVSGGLMALIAAIWGVLLARFVFVRSGDTRKEVAHD